jgi:S1-C subfamily serine protease
MRRALILTALLVFPPLLAGQSTSVLRITVTLPGEGQQPMPIARHVLLISDNPATTIPRRVLTGPAGTVELPLVPGSYTVESDRPATLAGKAYEWTQMIDVVAGRTATLALTIDNANVVAVPESSTPAGTEPPAGDPSLSSAKWLESLVAVWSPTSRTTGFLVDARGLIATRGLAQAAGTTVALQVSPSRKVSARVLSSDRARDVAIVWVHPEVMAGRTPIPLACQGSQATPAGGHAIAALTAPLWRSADTASGEITGSSPFALETDLRLGFGGAGGPVFNEAGTVVGLTAVVPDSDRNRSGEVLVVRAGILCEAVAAAQQALSAGKPPEPLALPVEPPHRDVAAATAKAGPSTTPPVLASSDFDIAIITPQIIEQARQNDRTGGRTGRSPEAEARLGRLTEFGEWSDYFANLPPVIAVRITPKLVEGFWKRVAREAARTQGADLPPFKNFKSSFVRMRVSCDATEVVALQPFVLEHKTSDTKVIREGLYVFDPGAFAPPCSRVTLSIYSENAPGKADAVTLDASLLAK